jgi:hypothetical protein
MRKWLALAFVVIAVAAAWYFLRSSDKSGDEKSNYYLTQGGVGICKLGENVPFLEASELPDTVPMAFSHASSQRFENRRFHFLSVSPDQRLVAFACGEGDQWLGLMNMERRYVKFLMFGIQTTFYQGLWSTDNHFLAFAYFGPDKRMTVAIIDPLGTEDPLPMTLNAWFKSLVNGEKFKPLSWRMDTDTVFTFAVMSASGSQIEKVDLPLRFNRSRMPEHMKQDIGKMGGK